MFVTVTTTESGLQDVITVLFQSAREEYKLDVLNQFFWQGGWIMHHEQLQGRKLLMLHQVRHKVLF